MTASLMRRLTDVGSDADVRILRTMLRLDAADDGAATTSDLVEAGADPREIADAILEVARSRGRRTLVALLSPAQALELEAGGKFADRILMRLRDAAAKTPLPQRMIDLRHHALVRGEEPTDEVGAVVRLVDGEVLPQASVRDSGRKRLPRRYTLSTDAIAIVDKESERRGVPASQVVEEAIRAIRS